MAKLEFSHSENWCGLVNDFYFCDHCGAQYAFKHGTMPELDSCQECDEKFDGADFNDQIGG